MKSKGDISVKKFNQNREGRGPLPRRCSLLIIGLLIINEYYKCWTGYPNCLLFKYKFA